METLKFQNLIQQVTGRPFIIKTDDKEIINGKDYIIYYKTPILDITAGFKWKAATTDEKLLRSLITAFCSKYREPNPKSYDYTYGGKEYKWAELTDEKKEYCFLHHASHMYSKKDLLKQIENNFANPSIEKALLLYGFYTTEYGIGIFAFWETQAVVNAISKLKQHLNNVSIPYKNEFSDARWVYRFKLNLSKEVHNNILTSFCS